MKKIIDFIKKYWKLILSILGLATGAAVVNSLIDSAVDAKIKKEIDADAEAKKKQIDADTAKQIDQINKKAELEHQLNDHLSVAEQNAKLNDDTKQEINKVIADSISNAMEQVKKYSNKG